MDIDQSTTGVLDRARRPVIRAIIVLAIAAGLFLLWRQAPPAARIVVANAAGKPLHDVRLTLTTADGVVLSEQLDQLGPGARWEHDSPQYLVHVTLLAFLLDDRPYQGEDLADLYAGRELTLTVLPNGRVDAVQASQP